MARRPCRGVRIRTGLLGVLAICLFPAGGAAQTISSGDRPVTGFLNLSAGLARPSSTEFSTVAEWSDGDWPNYTIPPLYKQAVRAEYDVKNNWTLDVGGGVLLARGLGIGVSVSRYADERPADVSVTLEQPDIHPTLVAHSTLDRLDRTEVGVHVQFVYVVPTASRFQVLLLGGPSRLSVKQDAVGDLDSYVDFSLSTDSLILAVSELESERVNASGWGVNVGTDVSYFASDSIGIGALIRYSQATVSLPNPTLSTIRHRTVTKDVDAGGLQVSAGLRLRF